MDPNHQKDSAATFVRFDSVSVRFHSHLWHSVPRKNISIESGASLAALVKFDATYGCEHYTDSVIVGRHQSYPQAASCPDQTQSLRCFILPLLFSCARTSASYRCANSRSPILLYRTTWLTVRWLAVWISGNALASINVVALRQTRLVPRWVTVCGRVNHLGI